eukprot:Seg1653.2 transcript_id=Seg1653.2/GoldUCD/mRNA.D3Y31 product="hypothetical protein" protein_id=Seg1653.2/GoldUCD/D3Y31
MKTLIYLTSLILLNAVCESAKIANIRHIMADAEEDQWRREQDQGFNKEESEIERYEDFEDSDEREDDEDFAAEGNDDINEEEERALVKDPRQIMEHEIRVRGCYMRGIVLDCYYEKGFINIKNMKNSDGHGNCFIGDYRPMEPWRNDCSALPSKAKAKIMQGCQGKSKCRIGHGGFKVEDHCPNVSKFTVITFNCTSGP